MAAEDLLRLAWEADHDGRPTLRDAMLTLALVESAPTDVWPMRCRGRLLADRPGHYLGGYPTVFQALGDPRVLASRDRLRRKYPPERVGWLLLGARVARGAYTGRTESLDAMIDDLAGSRAEADGVRLDAPEPVRGPLARARSARPVPFSLAYPPMAGRDAAGAGAWDLGPPARKEAISAGEEVVGRRLHYYSILFAIAMLLASLPEEDSTGRPMSVIEQD